MGILRKLYDHFAGQQTAFLEWRLTNLYTVFDQKMFSGQV